MRSDSLNIFERSQECIRNDYGGAGCDKHLLCTKHCSKHFMCIKSLTLKS